jgi:hypothetical protein
VAPQPAFSPAGAGRGPHVLLVVGVRGHFAAQSPLGCGYAAPRYPSSDRTDSVQVIDWVKLPDVPTTVTV